jgi:hypothetical protein
MCSETDEVVLMPGVYLVVPTSSMAKMDEHWENPNFPKGRRRATLVVHGDVPYFLQVTPTEDAEVTMRASLDPILHKGTIVQTCSGKTVQIMELSGAGIKSYAVKNMRSLPIYLRFKGLGRMGGAALHSHRKWLARSRRRDLVVLFGNGEDVEVFVPAHQSVVLEHVVGKEGGSSEITGEVPGVVLIRTDLWSVCLLYACYYVMSALFK